MSVVKPPKLLTSEDVYKQWQDCFVQAEKSNGFKQFCVVGITNNDETFHYTSGGGSYRNMLGALEHLKLSFFLRNQD
jgi:hypothetical protein